MPGEIIAGIAIAEVFGWVWDTFGKDIVKASAEASTKPLKMQWNTFNLKRAAERYAEDMKQQHNIMHIWRMAKPVPLEGIFTHVNHINFLHDSVGFS